MRAALAADDRAEVDRLAAAGADPQAGLDLDPLARGALGVRVSLRSSPGPRFRPAAGISAWRRFFHCSSAARSVVLSSSVEVSGWLVGRFSLDDDGFAAIAAGTGTTRPQSGHLPDSGIGLSGSTRTFSRRPQGQPKRMNPSPSPGPDGEPARRTRIRAEHLGQTIRSGPSGGTVRISPQRQVARGMAPSRLVSIRSRDMHAWNDHQSKATRRRAAARGSRPGGQALDATGRWRLSRGITAFKLPERNP